MVQDILTAPNPKLNQVSQRVQKLDKATQRLIGNLKDTLAGQKNPEGVGLSAPQIGALRRIFVLRFTPKGGVTVVINPKITKHSQKTNLDISQNKEPDMEGCLSVPGVYAVVERPWKITAVYCDEDFKKVTQSLEGFAAVAFQHELDHLEGILFTQRALEQGSAIIVD
ncbi:MAG: peptide deformylase [bacterium]